MISDISNDVFYRQIEDLFDYVYLYCEFNILRIKNKDILNRILALRTFSDIIEFEFQRYVR